MKRKALSAVVYAIPTFALAEYFDALYGGEPIIFNASLIRIATCGAALFAVACVLSLFSLRSGLICGMIAGTHFPGVR
ncbi:exported hypothetical protein [Candidatus Sulfopaludibacter sp. SbA3]|nr:exported hypothetical protein [Candidatus Sulfopaludibacter sp. SbA3]